MLVKDAIALVTGAAGGIGAACALQFAQQGAKAVYVVDRDEAKAQATLEQIRQHCACHFFAADVTDEDSVRQVYAHIMETYGRLDILVCCAGVIGLDGLYEMTVESWQRIMDINLKGVLLFSREAMKIMKAQKSGSIVELASIAGQVGGIRTNPAYACSKAGILALVKSLAKDGAPHGVRVNAIAPGIIATDMIRAPGFNYRSDEVPLRNEIGRPEDVAYGALFLSSYMADHITGQCLNINGGMYMN